MKIIKVVVIVVISAAAGAAGGALANLREDVIKPAWTTNPFQGTINEMKNEIHRLQVKQKKMKEDLEKMLQDMKNGK